MRPGAQRLGDRRRVPLRRVLPRRRRAGARVRRRHALVPGRLDRRLPRAARAGRRAAAPLGRLHAARLRRGPARVARRCAASRSLLVVGDRLALPDAAVPGRRAHAAARSTGAPPWVGGGGGRARSCSSTCCPAGCAASPSCRPSSTGSSSPRCSSRRCSCSRSGSATAPPTRRRVADGGDCGRSPLGAGGGAPALHDLLADRRDVPRHHGPAARGRPLLHQPRRPRRPSYDAGGARPARRLLPAAPGVRRPRPALRTGPGRRGRTDTVVLELPARMVGGLGGELLSALVDGRRVRGVPVDLVGADDRGGRRDQPGRDGPAGSGGVARLPGSRPWSRSSYRCVLARARAEGVGVARAVGLAFAVAASTFCPLLVLGIWWRRLTDVGAIAGLVVGGALSGAAVVLTPARRPRRRLARRPARPAGRLDRAAGVRDDGRRSRCSRRPGCPAHVVAHHGPAAHPRGRGPRPRTAAALTVSSSVPGRPPHRWARAPSPRTARAARP